MHSDADKVHKKTNLSDDLMKITSDKGFMISENRASGNCMFYALSEQLKHVKGMEVPHQELRETLVQFLRENPNLVRRQGWQSLQHESDCSKLFLFSFTCFLQTQYCY